MVSAVFHSPLAAASEEVAVIKTQASNAAVVPVSSAIAPVQAEPGFDWNGMLMAVMPPVLGLVLLVLIWGYCHHFCCGIRYLVLDLDIGLDKAGAFKSASVVMGASLGLTLVFALKLFGAW